MTKEEYVKKRELLHKEMMKLNEQYLDSNAKYKIGDRFMLTDRYYKDPIMVEVSGIGTDYIDDVKYFFVKVKKDGTKSTIVAYVRRESILEPISK
jgi:hypothetical protein